MVHEKTPQKPLDLSIISTKQIYSFYWSNQKKQSGEKQRTNT